MPTWVTVDSTTVLIGLFTVAAKVPIRYFRGHHPCMSRDRCAADLLNGVTLVPFGLMIMSVFSPDFLQELVHSNMVLLSTAGGVGGFFALGEILKAPDNHQPLAPLPPTSGHG